MHERHAVRDARRAGEFEAFVAGAGGRLLHAATLLTAESPDANPRARRLLTTALAHTYAAWDSLRGEDPYEHARQQLAVRFARTAWRQHRGQGHWHAQWYTRWVDLADHLWHALLDALRPVLEHLGRAAHRIAGGASRSGGGPDDHAPDGSPTGPRGAAPPPRPRRSRPTGVLNLLSPQERLILVLRMYEGVAEEQTAALLGLPTERVRGICARAMSTLLHPPPPRARSLPKVVPS